MELQEFQVQRFSTGPSMLTLAGTRRSDSDKGPEALGTVGVIEKRIRMPMTNSSPLQQVSNKIAFWIQFTRTAPPKDELVQERLTNQHLCIYD